MNSQDHAKEQITYWLQLAKTAEDEHPRLFRRVEQELLATGARYVDFKVAHRVALSYAEQFVTPESYRAGLRQDGQSAKDFADKYQISRLTAAIVASANLRMTQQVYSFDPTLAVALVEPEIVNTPATKRCAL